MKSPLSITILSGLASAVLFASPLTGSVPALLIALFAPIPLVFVSFSLGIIRGAQAGLIGLIACTAFGTNIYFPIIYTLTTFIPYIAFVHMLYLSRPVDVPAPDEQATEVEWYPIGRLVVWMAIVSGGLSALFILMVLGSDAKTYVASIDKMVAWLVKAMETAQNTKITSDQITRIKTIFYYNLPISLSMSLLFQMIINLWFGGRLAQNFGYIARPWPAVKTIEYPGFFVILFAASLVAITLFKGMPNILAITFAAAFLLAGVIFGLSVAHTLLEQLEVRWPFLLIIYVSLFFFFLPTAIVLTILGVGDPIFKLKQRALEKAQSDKTDRD